ncbi:hypothetical protein PIB30_033563 [Stylosanthes scabra]|uniref:Alcohol dehydrogenase-like N-terminal domain-containing protein n=1 Tax=Stylosanthes scabra TaxID=79078 RepID=A0ABU6WAY9_9FABA|nr:hypothetical protein [Stylosanthes scabra]
MEISGAVCWKVGEAVKIEEIQVDPPKANEVRLKMLSSSICHTDISSIQGTPMIQFYPLALGHEGVGVVESVGNTVKSMKEGDMVIPTYIGECQECENCISGKSNLCLTYPRRFTGLMSDNTSRMSCRGQRLCHLFSCATWSEYTVVDVNYLVKIDPSMNPAHASFISCGFSTGYGAAWKEARVKKGSSVTVFGLGAVELGGSGKTIMLGVGAEPYVSLGVLPIISGRTLKGSVLGGLKSISDLPIIADKCIKQEFPLEELFTHEVQLTNIEEAFELLKQPNCVKVVIKI